RSRRASSSVTRPPTSGSSTTTSHSDLTPATDGDPDAPAPGRESLRAKRRLPGGGVTATVLAVVAIVVVSINAWAGSPVTFATVSVVVITGISLGSIYAMAASGGVVTYTT